MHISQILRYSIIFSLQACMRMYLSLCPCAPHGISARFSAPDISESLLFTTNQQRQIRGTRNLRLFSRQHLTNLELPSRPTLPCLPHFPSMPHQTDMNCYGLSQCRQSESKVPRYNETKSTVVLRRIQVPSIKQDCTTSVPEPSRLRPETLFSFLSHALDS